MLAEYYNHPISTEKLEEALNYILTNRNVGITPASARMLVEQGLAVEIQTHQLELMTQDIINKYFSSAVSLEDALKKSQDTLGENAKIQLKEFLQFLEAGGTVSTHLATLSDIDTSLESGNPVRINIAPKVFYSESRFNTHAVVVVGKGKNGYVINDPSPRSTGQYTVDPDTLLFAWYVRGAMMFTASE